jgi:thiamine pyrophosphate-dependent acetolactate synthase large subunit-like protein
MPARTDIVRRTLDAADARGIPLIVGNGFLAREAMALSSPGERLLLPLQGGMGLAAGVAVGLVAAKSCVGAVVLEGDGNHLMGWGCAQLIGRLRVPVLHVVAVNGLYASTGGQQVPSPCSDAATAAAALGYELGVNASDDAHLVDALATFSCQNGPLLVYAAEPPAEPPPPRSPHQTCDYRRAFEARLGRPTSIRPKEGASGKASP